MKSIEVSIKTLIRLLENNKHLLEDIDDIGYKKFVYITFGPDHNRKAEKTIVFEAVDRTEIVIDVNNEGKAIGIEFC
jgi:hypothetical protein